MRVGTLKKVEPVWTPGIASGKDRLEGLLRRVAVLSFLNLFLVSCLGLVLRSAPFLNPLPLNYKNLLHGHSHFAFGGWVLPILLVLVVKMFPVLSEQVAYRHWRNISAMLMLSAYGMLVAFPLQGYKAVSISFSTLSVAATFYLAVVVWKALKHWKTTASVQFLRAGLFYLVLSAAGPFATGPLIATGQQGEPVYYNAIYFYLHFQYNGWFTFAVLALLYTLLEKEKRPAYGASVFRLFHYSCLPAYALSVLWTQPSLVFNLVGGLAASAQLVGIYFLLKDLEPLRLKKDRVVPLFRLAVGAFVLKCVLQLASAAPLVARLAYQHRNFVIAYLHLVLLGFISLAAFAAILKAYHLQAGRVMKTALGGFLFALLVTEGLLVAQASGEVWNFAVPRFAGQMLVFSLLLPASLFALFWQVRLQLRCNGER